MMGQQPRMEPMFYYFRLEDQIPEHHLFRRIDRYVDFRFLRERLRDAYSSVGRPSIDPEILLAHLAGGVPVRDYQRAPSDRRSAHAPSALSRK